MTGRKRLPPFMVGQLISLETKKTLLRGEGGGRLWSWSSGRCMVGFKCTLRFSIFLRKSATVFWVPGINLGFCCGISFLRFWAFLWPESSNDVHSLFWKAALIPLTEYVLTFQLSFRVNYSVGLVSVFRDTFVLQSSSPNRNARVDSIVFLIAWHYVCSIKNTKIDYCDN